MAAATPGASASKRAAKAAPTTSVGRPRAAATSGKKAAAKRAPAKRAAAQRPPAKTAPAREAPEISATAQRAADSAVGTEPVAIPSAGEMVGAMADTLKSRAALLSAGRQFVGDLLQIARGSSTIAPEKGDWRFADPSWRENPLYRRVGQSYLSSVRAIDSLVDAAEATGKNTDRARFTVNLLTSAIAPTNFLLGNPAALKRTFDTSGASVVRGARNWVNDVRHNGGLPSMASPGALQVGRDLALTPGGVVQRDEVAEVIQYTPTTGQVYERPVLIVPPPIGRYYFLDLAPERSFVEYSVSQGLQTFMLSWRNPGKDQADWNLDTYATRVLSAIEALREITGSDDVNIMGFCAGGIISSGVLNYLAACDDDRVNSVSFAVTMLDFGLRAPIQAFSSAKLMSFARSRDRRKGVISARDMGAAFTFMRPNDLVWNYWVNNYLMGKPPPVFDILSWNADGTNLPAALHMQFLDMFENNPLPEPGATSMLDIPMDLSTIKTPAFVVGAVTDHLTPWKGCYQTTQLLSGPMTFVLSNSGHIQSLVNPPGNPKASYYVGGDPGPDPSAWLSSATKQSGSWWEKWSEWIGAQSGAMGAAPQSLGSDTLPVLVAAPGDYVTMGAPQPAKSKRTR